MNTNNKSIMQAKALDISKARLLTELISISIVSFSLPFLLSHTNQQVVVGTLVNAMLIRSALAFGGLTILPAVFMPSFGVLARGAMFGSLTPMIIYTAPFVWLGNFSLIYIAKFFIQRSEDKRWNKVVSSIVSSFTKALIIGLPTFALSKMGIVPAALVIPMSLVQFVTAMLGNLISYSLLYLEEKRGA